MRCDTFCSCCPPRSCRSLAILCAQAAVVFLAAAPTARAQEQPPPAQITIDDPLDGADLTYGTSLKAKVSSNQPNADIHVVISNTYNDGSGFVTNTRTIDTTTDANGNWQDSGALSVFGPGNWSVDVELKSNPSVNDHHDGTVKAVGT